jgi:hypothetical protein
MDRILSVCFPNSSHFVGGRFFGFTFVCIARIRRSRFFAVPYAGAGSILTRPHRFLSGADDAWLMRRVASSTARADISDIRRAL